MSAAHDRLAALWDALEEQGARVMRVPLDTISAHTANRIAAAEEKRLRILAEQLTPGPRGRSFDRPGDLEARIQDLAALVHAAITSEEVA